MNICTDIYNEIALDVSSLKEEEKTLQEQTILAKLKEYLIFKIVEVSPNHGQSYTLLESLEIPQLVNVLKEYAPKEQQDRIVFELVNYILRLASEYQERDIFAIVDEDIKDTFIEFDSNGQWIITRIPKKVNWQTTFDIIWETFIQRISDEQEFPKRTRLYPPESRKRFL